MLHRFPMQFSPFNSIHPLNVQIPGIDMMVLDPNKQNFLKNMYTSRNTMDARQGDEESLSPRENQTIFESFIQTENSQETLSDGHKQSLHSKIATARNKELKRHQPISN